MRSHAGRHQRRGAVAVDCDAWDVEPREDGNHAADVVSLLPSGKAAAADQVLDLGAVELGHLIEDFVHHVGGEVVGTDFDEGSLASPPDRGAAAGNDHSIGHARIIRPPGCGYRFSDFASNPNDASTAAAVPTTTGAPPPNRLTTVRETRSAGSQRNPASSRLPTERNRRPSRRSSRGRRSSASSGAKISYMRRRSRLRMSVSRTSFLTLTRTSVDSLALRDDASTHDFVSNASRVKSRRAANHDSAPVASRLSVVTASDAQATELWTMASRRTRTALRIGIAEYAR